MIPSVAPRDGGPSVAVVEMCRSLAREGAETLIATTSADGTGRLDVVERRAVEWRGVPSLFFRAWPGESFKLSPGLAEWLRSEVSRFDVVHVHGVFSHAPIAAARAARAAGVPYVVRPLGHLDAWSLRQGRVRKAIFLGSVGRAMLDDAEAMHWTTEGERRAAGERWARHPGFVVPLGVEEALLEEPKPQVRAPYVLALSRIHPKKGFEILIESFLDVAPEPWELVVAGSGEPGYVSSLRALAERSPGGRRIRFAGWVTGAEKRALLAGAEVFALPSRQENFGIAVAEALAAGTPVVVTEGVNLAEDVRERGAGWVVDGSRQGLSEGLRLALSAEAERGVRGEAARALARERFRWSSIAAALVRQYDAIVSKPGQH